MNYLIGIDVGTSATKTVLFDENGQIKGSVSCEYPLYQPENGWAEQKAEDWRDAVLKTLKEVMELSGVPAEEVKGIGISGQMHGLVMLDEQGEYLAKANSLWSLLDVGTGKPVMVNEAMHKGYEIDEKLDMEYAPRKIAVPEGGELLEPIVVKKHHLDTNHHVNNGQYINIAMEYLPDDFVIRQMRAEYKKQAFLDDVLHPYVVSIENGYVICLQDEAGKPYVSVEFQGQ